MPKPSLNVTAPRSLRPRRLCFAGVSLPVLLAIVLAMLGFGSSREASAQDRPYPGAGCVATMENRSTFVAADGTYVLPNVPANVGQYRVRVICPQRDGSVSSANSQPYALVGNGLLELPLLTLGPLVQQPTSLQLLLLSGRLTSLGATVRLQVQAILPDGSGADATLATTGTTYSSSNTAVATVDANGVVTATGSGNVVITARNDGLAATILIGSFGQLDSDGDGMPDSYEKANGLNPFDPTDAALDPDKDGLTNLQEYQLGTNPQVADTDGDGLQDGDEVKAGTNPLLADTDGDGLQDGDELKLGTNPLLADTDGDGISDGVEVKLGLNPLVRDAVTTVIGHVSGADGKPVAGASVTLLTYFNATTDTTGAFTILAAPTTLGPLTATARAIVQTLFLTGSSQPVTPVSGATTDVGTITLGQAVAQVNGIVTNQANQPVAGVQVVVSAGNDTRTAVTDGNGLYAVAGLRNGPIEATAFDPSTSLRADATGILTGASLTLNLKLGGFGTVAGTVRTSGGAAVGAGVAVSIRGSLNSSTVTDGLGHYSFAFVPLGPVTVDATDTAGNHGRSTALVSATSQTLSLDVQFLPRGTISGTVDDGTGVAVAGAAVMLRNYGQLSQDLSTTTDALGKYSFAGVYAGVIGLSAIGPQASLGGSATANLSTDGQAVTANISLRATGSITGTVYHADGTTPVAGAAVNVQGTALTATASAAGKYTIATIPLGDYAVSATEPATNDRSSTPVSLKTAGATVPLDLKLTGQGTLKVTVVDGGGATPVPNATIHVDVNNALNATQVDVSQADGTATFNGVLAGNITVNALDNTTGLAGQAQATLAAGGTAAVTVRLQSSGVVQGTVYQSDGTTLVAGVTVRLDDQGARVLSGGDGLYKLPLVPSGQHTVYVLDAQNNVLATNNNVAVGAQGQVVTANFVIVGRGTVTGHVLNPDGTYAVNVPVKLTSTRAGDPNPIGTQSDANGVYRIPNVVLGAYSVLAQQRDYIQIAYGFSTGVMPSNGATVTTDIQLSTSLVPSTSTLGDVNGEPYTIRETGALIDGSFNVFAGDGVDHDGGSVLSLVSGGKELAFTGQAAVPSDLKGRQVSISQTLAGLNVIRRIFVPQDGYFSRYLELLSNPTASPITVGVNLRTYFRNESRIAQMNGFQQQQIDPPHILQTSSGDSILNIADPQNPDRWVSFGGPQDDDPFLLYLGGLGAGRAPISVQNQQYNQYTTLPAVAEIFDGPGGRLQPTSAGFSQDSGGLFSTFAQSYATVTVPAGGTVGLLHFLSQQNRYAAATASAARLGQLPPEALFGLTTPDLQAIANFNVGNGVSSVAALPALNNTVTGTVVAADGATGIAGAGVSLVSSDAIFSRVYFTGTDGDGSYALYGNANGGPAIPAENYTVTATHPLTGVVSPNTVGTFDAGKTTSVTQIVFSNTGTLTGTVSRGPTVVNAAGTVSLIGGSFTTPVVVPIRGDGTYLITGVPAANYTLTAQVSNTLLTGTTTATLQTGQTSTVNINIGNAGGVAGSVTRPDGSLAINDTVYLRVPGADALRSVVDTSGHYAFTDVPTGTYTLDVYDAQSNSAVTATVAIASGALATQNLALKSSGTVNGKVTATDGSSVAGLPVTLTSTTSSGTQTLSTTTAADGTYSITGVQPGTIAVRTTAANGLQGTGNGSLPLAGQTVTINIVLSAVGTVRGTVLHAGTGTPAAGVSVTISPAPLTGAATVTADANGAFSFTNVPVGGFSLAAVDASNGDHGSTSDRIQANGEVRTVNVTLIGFGTLTVKVTDASNNPVPQAAITVDDGNAGKQYTGSTDAAGNATFAKIVAGGVNVTARDASSGLSNSTSATVVANTTTPVTLMLQAVGTVQGTVFGVDGATPVSGATLQLNAPYGPTTTSAADGTYKFASVSVGGSYAVQARDASGVVRANSDRQTLNTNGQVLTINLTFVGVGSVTGTVTNLDGTRAENATLQVVSKNGKVGSTQTVTTGGDGTYSVPELPLGDFSVTVQGLPSNLSGYGSGTITADGSKVVVDIQITTSTVVLPVTLTDGDGYPYLINSDGDYGSTGNPSVDPSAVPFLYAQQLLFNVAGGLQSSFADGSSPTTVIQTLSGQGVEITQHNLQGIDVTRKVYVPASGYFSRRLDTFTNTTSAPITIAVRSYGRERQSRFNPATVTTSNGNTMLDNTVLWLVDDDDTGNLPFPRSETASGKVFAGANAPIGLDSISQTLGQFYDQYAKLEYSTLTYVYQYKPVTIPANGTVSFLNFTVQEATSATAGTAAQRLVQLPTEALDGLSGPEKVSIVNFVVPTTPIAALPAPMKGGALSGHVYAGDGATPIPNALVYAQSTDLQYGSASTVTADATGAFQFTTLPNASYALEALDPSTGVTSDTTTGTYPANPTGAVTKDVSFTNTGILQGTLKPTGQTKYASASVFLNVCVSAPGKSAAPPASTSQPALVPGGNTGVCESATHTVAADGSFSFLTVLAGTAGVQAYIQTPQGASYSVPTNGSYQVQIPAKQTTSFTFNLPATGNISGTVSLANGAPAAGFPVALTPSKSGSYANTTTDSNGAYSFQSILLDSYTVTATDTSAKTSVSQTTTVTQDSTSTVNLTLVGKGTVVATVRFANGGIASGSQVYISTSTSNGTYSYGGYSDSNGQVTIGNVPTGAFSIRANYPGQSFTAVSTGTLTSDGQTLNFTATLSPVGTISGNVTNADGTIATGAYVTASDGTNEFSSSAQTDAAGNYSIYPVPADRLIDVSSQLYNNTTGRRILADKPNQKVPGDAQTLTVNLRYPGLAAAVVVKVQKADGTAVTNGSVYLKATDNAQSTQSANLDGTGTARFTSVVEGPYVAYAQYSSYSMGSKTFTVSPSQDGTTVNVTITTTPTGTVQGTVFAADGTTPIVLTNNNVDVTLTDNDTGLVAYNNDGPTQFIFAGAQVGASGYTLKASYNDNYDNPDAAKGATATGNITTEGQVITQNLTLPLSSINGTLYLHNGVTPAANIYIYGSQTTSNGTVTQYGITDANGKYQLNGFTAGTVTIFAETDSDVEANGTATLATNTSVVKGVDLLLEASGTVTGIIYDNNGLPLPNQSFYINSTAHNGGYQRYGNTDDNGNYVEVGIPVGTITLTSQIGGVNETSTGTLSNDGDTLTLNLPQNSTGSGGVFGTVFDSNGNPAANANVTLTPADTSVTPLHTTTNANGVYGASGLPVGDVTVSATLSNGTSAGSTTGMIADLQTSVEIDVGLTDFGQVSGYVVDNQGRRIGNLTVTISSSGDDSTSYQETADGDGNFFFGGIAPGRITFTVQGTSYSGTRTATLPYGGNLSTTVVVGMISAQAVPPALRLPMPVAASAQVTVAMQPQAKRPKPLGATAAVSPAHAAVMLRPIVAAADLPRVHRHLALQAAGREQWASAHGGRSLEFRFSRSLADGERTRRKQYKQHASPAG